MPHATIAKIVLALGLFLRSYYEGQFHTAHDHLQEIPLFIEELMDHNAQSAAGQVNEDEHAYRAERPTQLG